MEDEDIIEDSPSMDIASKDSFSVVTPDPVKDIETNTSEVDKMPLENLATSGCSSEDTVAVDEIDWSKEFETNMEFESREAVLQWCQEVGRKNNMVLVISSSRTTQIGKGSSIDISCERRGSYYSHRRKSERFVINTKRKRSTDRKQCGCRFKLQGTCRVANKWKVSVKCGVHNHTLPDSLTGNSYLGRLKKEEEDLVVNLASGGLTPRQILEALKENNKENHSTMRTIYNTKARLKVCDMQGMPCLEQLMGFLTQHHYLEYNRKDPESGEMIDIFWTHPEATLLTQCFPSVLIIDCTSKINQFKMPLFHIIGMTSTARSFTVAYALLKMETEEHYAWALTQLKRIYRPHDPPSVFVTHGEIELIKGINVVFPGVSIILCMSHIDSQIHDNCRKSFDNEEEWESFFSDWKHVCHAETEIDYSEALSNFVMRWVGRHGMCVTYACEKWFIQKEKFVCAWTNKIKHYGNTTSKRPEGEHAKTKAWLDTSHGTFLAGFKGMHKMFQDEYINIKASFEKSLTQVKQTHLVSSFKDIRLHVSQKAMDIIVDEMKKKVGIDSASCRCALRTTHGLPCAHELAQYAQESRPIPISSIDPHWKQLSSVPILENRVDFDFLPELQLLRHRWIEASEVEKRSLVDKMRDLATPIC